MKNLSPCAMALAVLLVSGCGDNMENPAPAAQFGPPTGLKALSINDSAVAFQWLATSASGDSTFRGYITQVAGRTDTFPKSTFGLLVGSLSPGVVTVSIYSLSTDGLRSDPATMRWAPASQFDSTYAVYEKTTLVFARPEGFNVGTTSTNPSVMRIDSSDPAVKQTMDLVFNGDSVQTHQSLSMWSANLLLGRFNTTLFSTQTDASPSLDFPLSAFPSENSFVKDNITVVDNTIYYAKVIGDPQQVNYARIHLHIRQGTFPPNRIIEVRVSLQRSPGLLFAMNSGKDPETSFDQLQPLIM